MSEAKTISILGATGSIGQNVLDVMRQHPERFELVAMSAHRNVARLVEDAKAFKPKAICVSDDAFFKEVKEALAGLPIQLLGGESGLLEMAAMDVDICIAAIVGAAGLRPAFEAVKHCGSLALANKEALVCAGELLIQQCEAHDTHLLPVDSEHNAIHQLLQNRPAQEIESITLTASGGPFLKRDIATFDAITPSEAVAHPNWSMGAKISVDSATMMNKGLELIEAFHLFPFTPSQLKVVIHPQSIIHGMVNFVDGSTLAQMGNPDMRTPIAYCMGFPARMSSGAKPLDLAEMSRLDFSALDEVRFPALKLAYAAMEQGQSACVALNAANEVAVDAFLREQVSFSAITEIVTQALDSHEVYEIGSLDDVMAVDAQVRKDIEALVLNMEPRRSAVRA